MVWWVTLQVLMTLKVEELVIHADFNTLQDSSVYRRAEEVHCQQEAAPRKRSHQAATSEASGIWSCSGESLCITFTWHLSFCFYSPFHSCLPSIWHNVLFCLLYLYRFHFMNLKIYKTRPVLWNIYTRKSSPTVTGWAGDHQNAIRHQRSFYTLRTKYFLSELFQMTVFNLLIVHMVFNLRIKWPLW